jgi:SAM-dependent methyltransferase
MVPEVATSDITPEPPSTVRVHAFGETHDLTVVDRFGVWLSLRQVLRWARDLAGKSIGDFGAGYQARLTSALLNRVELAYVADVAFAPEVARHAKVRAIEGPLPASLEAIPDGALDLVFCISVLEHVTEAEELLRQIHRVLKSGGRALINVPSWRGKRFLEFSAFRLGLSPVAEMDDHKTYYDVKDLWPLLVAAGFRPSRIRCFAHKFGLNTFAVCDKDRER